ncbi:MAG: UDP-glucose 4-epimerase [Planctomycetota bacterium]|jgi:UDP-glucose 4-epimerase
MTATNSPRHYLVTGGAGYIGSHAAIRLLDLGHRVTVIDSLHRGHRGAVEALRAVGGDRLRFEQADLRESGRLADVLAEAVPDAVLHFAALAYVGESVEEPLDYFACNVGGGLSLLAAMRRTGVRRIVFSSTCATYGEPDRSRIPISESVPQRPINPYGRSKLHFEEILRDEAARPSDAPLAAVALRYFNVAGCDAAGRLGEDHRPESHLIPIALEVALGKRPNLKVFGEDYETPDGTCIRDYVHVEDLVEAHVAALGAFEPGAVRAWNVGIGRGHSVREVVESCRRVTGHAIPTVPAPRRAGDPPVLFADPAAARRDLGFAPRWTDLDETVRSAWRWMRAHPSGYAD